MGCLMQKLLFFSQAADCFSWVYVYLGNSKSIPGITSSIWDGAAIEQVG